MTTNRFLTTSHELALRAAQGPSAVARGRGRSTARGHGFVRPMTATDRTLVLLVENGGIDLGIPGLVDRLISVIPGGDLISDSARRDLVAAIREQLLSVTDTLIESAELALNRFGAAKPSLYGDVVLLRDSTASYTDLKAKLLELSRAGKIIDLFILTHGSGDFISVAGGVDSAKIRAMRAELGRPLTIRSVYMMNCVASSLNQAWIDAGARTVSGARGNNYLPEPSMHFFWTGWKEGQTFETAVTSAYRRTVALMNGVVRGFVAALPIPGASLLASQIDLESLDVVQSSAPVVQGQRTVTITSDDLTFSQSVRSGPATTVVPMSVLTGASFRTAGASRAAAQRSTAQSLAPRPYRALGETVLSPAALALVETWELGTGDGPERRAEVHARAEEAASTVAARVTVPLTENQVDALVSFVCGISPTRFERSTVLTLLNDGSAAGVPAEMRKWVKARVDGAVVEIDALVRRRAAEAELFARGPDPAPPPPAVPVAVASSLRQDSRRDSRSGSPVRWSPVWSTAVPIARTATAVSYRVPGIVDPVQQPSPMTCWAAVLTTMYGWRHQVSMPVRDVLATFGPQYVARFDAGKSLDVTAAHQLYADAGLTEIISTNPTIDGWLTLLTNYGPLYVDIGQGTSMTTHAVVVTGIQGDGQPEGTRITYIDPAHGTVVDAAFLDFQARYESPGAVAWPYTIVHWPAPPAVQVPAQSPAGAAASSPATTSPAIQQSFRYESPSRMTRPLSGPAFSAPMNPLVVAGISVADAASIGLGAVSVAQAQASATAGSFTLTYAQAQRMLTNDARQSMPGSQIPKSRYSAELLYLGVARPLTAEATVIIEWEGNPYGEIGTPVIRRELASSTAWTHSLANISIVVVSRIPLPNTDPRAWPIVYSYEGTYDPVGNGHFEFTGELEVDAFGGLKFNRHEVVSRAFFEPGITGDPEQYVVKGRDVVVAAPPIPPEQAEFLRTHLP